MAKMKKMVKESFLALLQNSENTTMFKNFFMRNGREEIDVIEGGRLMCAYYATSMMLIMGLIKKMSATVDGALYGMKKAGWEKTSHLKPGNVLIWEKQDGHRHIGFYLGDDIDISSIPDFRVVKKHHYTFGKEYSLHYRKIEEAYSHRKLS